MTPLKVTAEPLFTSIVSWEPRQIRHGDAVFNDLGGEYLTFWYVGQIGPDAVREVNTGMPDEANYVGHLVTYDEAMRHLIGFEHHIVEMAWNTWQETVDADKKLEREKKIP